MSSNLFNQIAHELFGTAEIVDLRGWGESLLVKDFCAKLQIAANLSQSVRLVTNLSLERDDVLHSLCEAHAYVVVSLDSADPDVLKVVRCGAQLNTIVSNLRKLTSLYLKHWGSVGRICINCTLQRPALRTLPKLADLAADTGVHDIRLSAVSISPMSYLSLAGYKTDLQTSITRLIEVADRRGIVVTALTCLDDIIEPRERNQTCFHPWGYVCVNSDGSVGFCDHLIGPRFQYYLMGNLKRQDFQDIWNGDKWMELRRQHAIASRLLVSNYEKCARCSRKVFVELEDLFLPNLKRTRLEA